MPQESWEIYTLRLVWAGVSYVVNRIKTLLIMHLKSIGRNMLEAGRNLHECVVLSGEADLDLCPVHLQAVGGIIVDELLSFCLDLHLYKCLVRPKPKLALH